MNIIINMKAKEIGETANNETNNKTLITGLVTGFVGLVAVLGMYIFQNSNNNDKDKEISELNKKINDLNSKTNTSNPENQNINTNITDLEKIINDLQTKNTEITNKYNELCEDITNVVIIVKNKGADCLGIKETPQDEGMKTHGDSLTRILTILDKAAKTQKKVA